MSSDIEPAANRIPDQASGAGLFLFIIHADSIVCKCTCTVYLLSNKAGYFPIYRTSADIRETSVAIAVAVVHIESQEETPDYVHSYSSGTSDNVAGPLSPHTPLCLHAAAKRRLLSY